MGTGGLSIWKMVRRLFRREKIQEEASMNSLRKLALGSAAIVAFASLAASAWAQDQAPPMTVEKIKSNVYCAHDPKFGNGTGSNNGIIVGKTSVILVDTKTTLDEEKVVI